MSLPTSGNVRRHVLAVANQKGGVAKTTTAVNLAAAAAAAGHRVTLIDLDPQGNASTGLGRDRQTAGVSAFDVLSGDASFAEAAQPTSVPGLALIPASGDLASVDQQLGGSASRLSRLRSAIAAERNAGLIVIDTPPTLGLLTLNALAAADGVVVPLQAEYFALEGLTDLIRTIREVRSVNPGLRIDGVALTMHDARTRLAEQVEQDARANLGDLVFRTVIPRNVRLSEAPSFGQTIFQYDPQSRGAQAYRDLAAELLDRITMTRTMP